MIIHILFGFIAAWIPSVGILAVLYQLLQLIFNVRVFPVEGVIRPGNSIAHTSLKLGEMGIGYLAGLIVKDYLKG